jgi:hypothetical protein
MREFVRQRRGCVDLLCTISAYTNKKLIGCKVTKKRVCYINFQFAFELIETLTFSTSELH